MNVLGKEGMNIYITHSLEVLIELTQLNAARCAFMSQMNQVHGESWGVRVYALLSSVYYLL